MTTGATWIGRFRGVAMASAFAFLAPPAAAAIDQRSPPAAEQAPEIRLDAETVVLPFTMVREYPFVEGEIAGVTGKLLLDTGFEEALALNDHRIPLNGGVKVGTGFFGSGETFDIRQQASVDNIRIGNLRYARATSVQSQDARQLERITPDFLGWVGYHFFAKYALKMDYRRSQAIFYKGGPTAFLRGEKVIAVLPFETRKLPNHPLIAARIGDVDAIVSLDTGMNGSLVVPNTQKARLLASGHLAATDDPEAFDLKGVSLSGKIRLDFPGIEVEEGPAPAAKPIGVTEENHIELGYAFLRQFKTVWDFPGKRLYLLAR